MGIFKTVITVTVLLLLSELTSATTLSITPYEYAVLPSSILKNQTATAYYLVKNNTPNYQQNNQVRLPPNVTQILDKTIFPTFTCDRVFDLAPKGTNHTQNGTPHDFCILQLKITGGVNSNDPDKSHHLSICQSNSIECSMIENREEELNIIEGKPNNLARIAIVTQLDDISSIRKATAYKSDDNGFSWLPNEIDTFKGTIKSSTCDENNRSCIAVGVSNNKSDILLSAYISGDGGISWSSTIIDTFHSRPGDIADITCNPENSQYCVAVGSNSRPENPNAFAPIVYISSDNGGSWTPHYLKTFGVSGPSLRAVSCSGNNNQYCTAVGSLFSLTTFETTFISYKSIDAGENWTPNVIGKYQGLAEINSISCINNNQECVVVGALDSGQKSSAVIYKSVDGGVWSRYMLETDKSRGVLYDVSCNQNNHQCLAVGSSMEGPIIYKSIDNGFTWVKLGRNSRSFSGSAFKTIYCDGRGNDCIALGYEYNQSSHKNFPIISRSKDGGEHWVNINSYAFLNRDRKPPEIETQHISMH